ncbi:Hypothetical protein AAM4_1937 [Actinomyces succiniciruminis]|uniref:DUF6571 domain-containing protein n=1 Tax=Actinomyces succiniciruminis TaxID=1522002 RepID=A0A1L7RKW6_9ACTO|nr:Hypothetical protein AAM4_1937 [Actinomyces succiniciruminis]
MLSLSRETRQSSHAARRLNRWRWCGRAVTALCLSVSLAACGLINGSDGPTALAEAPLADETICGIFPNQDLQSILGFSTYWYSYSTSPTTNVETGESGYSYSCNMDSDSNPFGQLEISYGISTPLDTGYGLVEFDDIPAEYPDTAQEATFKGVEGEGWVWTDSVEIYVAWRYNNTQTLLARLTYWGPPENLDQQASNFHTILEPALAQIPELASTTPTHVTVPSPTPEAEDTATGNADQARNQAEEIESTAAAANNRQLTLALLNSGLYTPEDLKATLQRADNPGYALDIIIDQDGNNLYSPTNPDLDLTDTRKNGFDDGWGATNPDSSATPQPPAEKTKPCHQHLSTTKASTTGARPQPPGGGAVSPHTPH